jgi:hypothetical protein
MNERMDMKGSVTVTLADSDLRPVTIVRQPNRIVRSGRQLVAQLFGGVTAGTPPARVTHMAVGTGDTAPADDQTALVAERAPRKPIAEVTYTDVDEVQPGGGTVRRVRVSMRAIFDFGEANGADPLREAAIFTADAPGGTMYNRVVFPAVTKTAAFQLTLLWEITF